MKMTGVARGMAYLHSSKLPIIHGDLRAVSSGIRSNYRLDSNCPLQSNILIDDLEHPRISNFGLEMALDSQVSELYRSSAKGNKSLRWKAPELLNPFAGVEVGPTTRTDVYAFACVCIEVGVFHLC